MSKSLDLGERKRGQTLIIVEGNHEKNELFQSIFNSFPELSIRAEDVWIYGTNIYRLYEAIIKEYGEDWDETDIDLPLLVSERTQGVKRYKDDFTNIFLVFDYERHDPNFSADKIKRMQAYFSDATDNGQLYINYPMIEAYQDVDNFDFYNFMEKVVPVSLQPGAKYKAMVRNTTVDFAIEHRVRLYRMLQDRFNIKEEELHPIVKEILESKEAADFDKKMITLFGRVLEGKDVQTAAYQVIDHVFKVGYVKDGLNYWEHLRKLFVKIITLNIEKAYRIQGGVRYEPSIDLEMLKERFGKVDLKDVLDIQNRFSESEAGNIWVLSTCVMLVADYNFNLLGNN